MSQVSASPRLHIEGLSAGYERDAPVLRDISLSVQHGTITGIIGANGAGKSTLFKSILGYLKPTGGKVWFGDREITGLRPDLAGRLGIGYLMEGHSVFPRMSVEENLMLGAWSWRGQRLRVAEALERAYNRAPVLKQRRKSAAGVLSGGQQRILEIERLCMTSPSVIMLDEPSLGLAPRLAEEMFQRVLRFQEEGVSVILVDQNIRRVVELAHHVYVLQLGEIKMHGPGHELAKNIAEIVKEFI